MAIIDPGIDHRYQRSFSSELQIGMFMEPVDPGRRKTSQIHVCIAFRNGGVCIAVKLRRLRPLCRRINNPEPLVDDLKGPV